jgi:hypothetical protein
MIINSLLDLVHLQVGLQVKMVIYHVRDVKPGVAQLLRIGISNFLLKLFVSLIQINSYP